MNNLPTEGAFRLRGAEVTRLETFVDAAFAFAVTLLVISIDSIPETYDQFFAALLQIPTFLACFLQLLMFWIGHRSWSRRYGMENLTVLWTSLLLVAGILIIVYPLRVIFSAALSYTSGGYLPTPFEFNLEQLRTVFVFYGSSFGFLSALIASLYWQALRNRTELGLSTLEIAATRYEIQAWAILAGFGLISLGIAIIADDIRIIAAGWVYSGLAIVMPLQGLYASYRLRQLATEG